MRKGASRSRRPLSRFSWLLQQRRLVVFGNFLGWNDDRSGDLVIIFKIEQTNALRGAAGGADCLGVDTDDFAVLTDDHQFAGVVHQLNGTHAADARCDSHVLHAFAAASLQAILLYIGALAESVFSHGKNAIGAFFVLLGRDGGADHV